MNPTCLPHRALTVVPLVHFWVCRGSRHGSARGLSRSFQLAAQLHEERWKRGPFRDTTSARHGTRIVRWLNAIEDVDRAQH